MPPGDVYQLGEFRVDSQQRLLFRKGEIVPLTPKAFETLLVLVKNHGHVVNKDTLLKTIWPNSFVEEGSLASNVSLLRRVLEDGFVGRECIETIPKRGYRLVATVSPVQLGATAETADAIDLHHPRLKSKNRVSTPTALTWLAVVVLASGYSMWLRFHSRPVPTGRRIMLAV